MNYISKSGGNSFHGNAVYYWNGRAFNANNWFNKANGVPRPFDIANQWAGSLGGPIKKDKLFFFVNTEGLLLLIPSPPVPVVIPSPQFQAATITHTDSKFGASSASDAFYKPIFGLYNDAPGASRAASGAPSPSRNMSRSSSANCRARSAFTSAAVRFAFSKQTLLQHLGCAQVAVSAVLCLALHR